MSASRHVAETPQMTCRPDMSRHVGNTSKMSGRHLAKTCRPNMPNDMSPKTLRRHLVFATWTTCRQNVVKDILMTCCQNVMSTTCHWRHFYNMSSKCHVGNMYLLDLEKNLHVRNLYKWIEFMKKVEVVKFMTSYLKLVKKYDVIFCER